MEYVSGSQVAHICSRSFKSTNKIEKVDNQVLTELRLHHFCNFFQESSPQKKFPTLTEYECQEETVGTQVRTRTYSVLP